MVSIKRFLPFAFAPLLGACASITAGTTQTVAIDTNPQRPAECQLSNEKGSWTVAKTPGSTTVNKAYGPLTATCRAPDGMSGVASLQSTTAGATFGNLLVGGIIGAAVDMGSGAAYQYPPQITVPIAAGGDGALAKPQAATPPAKPAVPMS